MKELFLKKFLKHMENIENKKNYHPGMHSAEHILNQTMIRLFNTGRAFSIHVEKKKSKCDYRIERNLSEEEISLIENKVNEVINSNLEVKEEFIKRDEAGKEFNLEKLPEDAGDTLRIINIGDYDSCPCSGQHVKNTSEIGTFRIISHNFNDGVLRLRFKLDV
jgi:misacylated tRNA(Ala) deacylase